MDLERRALEAVHVADETAKRAEASAAALGGLPVRPVAPTIDRELLIGIHARAERLASGLEAARTAAARFDAPLRARVDAGALRAGELGDELRRLGAAEVGLRQELEEATERVTAAEVELARLDAETREATRRLEAAGGRACRRR